MGDFCNFEDKPKTKTDPDGPNKPPRPPGTALGHENAGDKPKRVINALEIKKVVERFGGWDCITAGISEPPEEFLLAIEELGIPRKFMLSQIKRERLPARDRIIQDMASELNQYWSYLKARNMTKSRSTPLSTTFDRHFKTVQDRFSDRMRDFQVSLSDIKEEIDKNPSKYAPEIIDEWPRV